MIVGRNDAAMGIPITSGDTTPGEIMSQSDPRLDDDAKRAIRRIEQQMFAEGKLDKAVGAEGAAIVLFPVFIGVVGFVGWFLKSMGVEGPEVVYLGVPMMFAIGAAFLYLADRR